MLHAACCLLHASRCMLQVMATRTALKLADYVVTEAGFGADLGAVRLCLPMLEPVG